MLAGNSESGSKGRFQKGYDPRRHYFTQEECQRGFWAAIDSIVDRYPDAIGRGNRHMATRFLCAVIRKKQRG